MVSQNCPLLFLGGIFWLFYDEVDCCGDIYDGGGGGDWYVETNSELSELKLVNSFGIDIFLISSRLLLEI